jgi:hypothetical protein
MTSVVELVPLSKLREYPENPKAPLGAAYKKALDTSLEEFEFKGALSLTPRCDEEHAPLLAHKYGADGCFIVADGNKRLDRIAAAGYRWVLALPGQHSSTGGLEGFLDALATAGTAPVDHYRSKVRAGEKVALGFVYADLNTPTQLKKFALTFDRARAKYDEEIVQRQLRELLDEGEERKVLLNLATVKLSTVSDVIEQERKEAAASVPGTKTAEQVAAERKILRAQQREMIGPFFLTQEQHAKYLVLMKAVRGTVPPWVLPILEMALAMKSGVEDDLLFGHAIERAYAIHQQELGR